MTTPPRRTPVFGPEPWATTAGADWSHFNRWFALVPMTAFDGSPDGLRAELVARLRSSLYGVLRQLAIPAAVATIRWKIRWKFNPARGKAPVRKRSDRGLRS